VRVRVSYVVDVSDEMRRAINLSYDKPGLASREEIKAWYWLHGMSMEDDLMGLVDAEEVPVPLKGAAVLDG
jgi:hypothetical protein